MTKPPIQHPTAEKMDVGLETVLDAYAASEPGPSRASLAEWIRKYPQYARELLEFTAQWQFLECADWAAASNTAIEGDVVSGDDPLLLRGVSAAQSAFYAMRGKKQLEDNATAQVRKSSAARNDAPISSLTAAATRVGLPYVELKDRIGLSDALLQKLNRRLVDPLTIPIRVLSDLATALEHPLEAVVAYTKLAPAFAVGAQHRASQAPALPNVREDFFDAVRNDLSIAGSRREELLALPRPGPTDARATEKG